MQKVLPGQPLRIPAETFNTFIDAAKDFRQRTQNRGQKPLPTFSDPGIVLVKNASGNDFERFDVLGIEQLIFSSSDNLLKWEKEFAIIAT